MKNVPSACPSASSNIAVCDSLLSKFGLNEIAVLFIRSQEEKNEEKCIAEIFLFLKRTSLYHHN